MANQYNSYYLYQKYEKRGNQDWLPCYPNIFSVDGDGTMPLVLKQENDQACGYIPSGETMYRWINLDPSVDYYCLECGTDALKVSGTYGSGETFSVNCNESSVLTSGELAYSGRTYAKVGNCVTEIDNRAFMVKISLSGVSIPSTVTTIGASAFTDSNALIDCVLPESVTSIGDAAFMNCISLSNFVLWNTVTSIGISAFTNCDSIISINIPTGITSVPAYCFYGCGALSEITIPTGVTDIGNRAFYGCTGLVSITVRATTPPTLEISAYDDTVYVFDETNNCPIYVPEASVNTYKSAWSKYSSRIQAIIS